VDFFKPSPPGLSVLDLGCGQGRDALVAARQGHAVHGIDIATSGIIQLAEIAQAEDLDVQCEVMDMQTYDAERMYEVVVLDRVLHMLPSEDRRRMMLSRAKGWVATGGHILIADTKRNRDLIRGGFVDDEWEIVLRRRDYFWLSCTFSGSRSESSNAAFSDPSGFH
jgi:tellurite methyltransferase